MDFKHIIEQTDFTQNRSDFWTDLLTRLLGATDGNIVEIGAGYGVSTDLFCQIAAKFDRKVLVIDPFESDWENMPPSYRYPYEKFEWDMRRAPANWTVHKYPSQDFSCHAKIREFAPIAFAFVDGLQTMEAVLSDLNMMALANSAIICVDDANRLTGDCLVPTALIEFQKYSDYKVICEGREAYLCR